MDPLMDNYEALSDLMGRMRIAASQAQWDDLVVLEQQCSQRVKSMQEHEAAPPLNEAARQRRIALIRKMLADDAEIRSHTQPWMEKLQRGMGSANQERRLQQTYSSQY